MKQQENINTLSWKNVLSKALQPSEYGHSFVLTESLGTKYFSCISAYTMAKYGMSMCALGMAEEFREEGVAVNALWPRTGRLFEEYCL